MADPKWRTEFLKIRLIWIKLCYRGFFGVAMITNVKSKIQNGASNILYDFEEKKYKIENISHHFSSSWKAPSIFYYILIL